MGELASVGDSIAKFVGGARVAGMSGGSGFSKRWPPLGGL